MKISPINIYPKSFNVSKNSVETHIPYVFDRRQSPIPFFAYKSNFLTPVAFKGTESVDDFNLDFECEKLENTLKTKMMVKTPEDIQKSLDKVCEVTGVDEKTAAIVMSRATQFHEYTQLCNALSVLEKNGMCNLPMQENDDLNINNLIDYYGRCKGQFQINKREDRRIIFVDRPFLEASQKKLNLFNKKLVTKHLGIDSNTTFVILDGLCTDDESPNKSYSFLGADNSLENVCISLIEDMKNTNQTLDEVLNKTAVDDVKNLFGMNAKVLVLQNPDIAEPNAKSISEKMKPQMPDKEQIKKFVQTVSSQNVGINKTEAQRLICKYLSNCFNPYSTERINSELKELHNKIIQIVNKLGKKEEDIIYLIPRSSKSFGLVSYQYAKINKVPYENLSDFYSNSFDNNKGVLKDKIFVVLDDVAASGKSIISDGFCFEFFEEKYDNEQQTNIIYAPMSIYKRAIRFINHFTKESKRKKNDFIVSTSFQRTPEEMKDVFNKEELVKIQKLMGGSGYASIRTATVFPFSVTDTNAQLPLLFSTYFVNKNNTDEMFSFVSKKNNFMKMPYSELLRQIGAEK